MNLSKISVRYAKALYQLAEERKKTDLIREDILLLIQAFQYPNLIDYIGNPVVTTTRKKELFGSLFSKEMDPLTMQFFDLVLNNRRESFLPDISRVFLSLYKKEKGITEVRLTTATSIDRQQAGRIIDLVEKNGKTVDLKEETDPAILGGFILRIDDRQMDASIINQLRKIKRELMTKDFQRKV